MRVGWVPCKRKERVTRSEAEHLPFDLLVVGGGIIGAGIARDAAGRGLSVLLCERGDLACGTSSASTKLVHGGLRYLEYRQVWLVREALAERERLLEVAPHAVRPLPFVLPHDRRLRAAWRLRLGLFLYDHLARQRRLPRSRCLDLANESVGAPLKEGFATGFAYPDCWVDDSRLVVLNALEARERGAVIRPRTELMSARRGASTWLATLRETGTGRIQTIHAKMLVNATGPRVSETLAQTLGLSIGRPVRLLKGSHIVTRRLYEGDWAYFLQNEDGRLVYVLPFEGDFTLIGTTDVDFERGSGPVAISEAETDYLCAAVNRAFVRPISRADIVWSFAGVRPLYDDAVLESRFMNRDYALNLRDVEGKLPVLSVFGAKITTYRRIAERAVDKLRRYVPHLPGGWTAGAILPGGDFKDLPQLSAELRSRYPEMPPALLDRLARSYGTRAARILGEARRLEDLGETFGADLTEAELAYLQGEEWAQTAEDALWRRSKLGLRLNPADVERVAAYLARNSVTASAVA